MNRLIDHLRSLVICVCQGISLKHMEHMLFSEVSNKYPCFVVVRTSNPKVFLPLYKMTHLRQIMTDTSSTTISRLYDGAGTYLYSHGWTERNSLQKPITQCYPVINRPSSQKTFWHFTVAKALVHRLNFNELLQSTCLNRIEISLMFLGKPMSICLLWKRTIIQ